MLYKVLLHSSCNPLCIHTQQYCQQWRAALHTFSPIGYYEHQSISATSSYLEAFYFCRKHVNMQNLITLWLPIHRLLNSHCESLSEYFIVQVISSKYLMWLKSTEKLLEVNLIKTVWESSKISKTLITLQLSFKTIFKVQFFIGSLFSFHLKGKQWRFLGSICIHHIFNNSNKEKMRSSCVTTRGWLCTLWCFEKW